MAEVSSRQSQMLVSAAASTQAGVLLLDSSLRVVWANPAMARLVGRPHEPLVDMSVDALLSGPSGDDSLHQVFADVRRTRQIRAPRVQVARGDGRVVHLELVIGPIDEADGTVGFSAVARDVSEQVERARESARLRDRLHTAFRTGPMPQGFLDLSGRFREVNEALASILECTADDLVGMDMRELIDPMDPARNLTVDALLSDDSGRQARHEVIARSVNGRQVSLLVNVVVLRDEAGEPSGLSFFAQELTNVRDAEMRLVAQQEFFNALHRRAWDLALVADAEGHVVYASPAVTDVLGYEVAEILTMSGFDFVHPDDMTIAHAVMAELMAAPGTTVRNTFRIKNARGEWRWCEQTAVNCLADPVIGGIVTNMRDVTGEVEARRALEASERRYRAIVETAQEGIVAVDADARTTFANNRLAQMTGYPLEDIYEYGLIAIAEPDVAKVAHQRFLDREARGAEQYEVDIPHPDGETRTYRVSASPLVLEPGEPTGSLATLIDVTAQRRAEVELHQRALHDPLTGLPNRALLNDRIAMACARHARAEYDGGLRMSTAVLFLDVDRLKLVNDVAGHAAGDAVLVEIARRLVASVRETDTVGRLGGDEFAVVCEDTGEVGAALTAGRIQAVLDEPFLVHGQEMTITASIGVAVSPPHPAPDLLGLADNAMYDAKRGGTGQYVVFDNEMAAAAQRRTTLAAQLRQALANEELELHYQPIVDLRTSRLQGVETLVRWRHRTMGLLLGSEVVTAAADAGLGTELDRYVLRRAARQSTDLYECGALHRDAFVTVNVSVGAAVNEPIEDEILSIVEAAGMPRNNLVIEVTETSVMADVERTAAKLRALRTAGLRVALDDFGTGYSSLAYVHRLPLSVLKIDRSFVAGLPDEEESLAIVKSVLSLAGALGLQTIGEGIETEAHATSLRYLGCHLGQGYLWSPALSAPDLVAFLDSSFSARR